MELNAFASFVTSMRTLAFLPQSENGYASNKPPHQSVTVNIVVNLRKFLSSTRVVCDSWFLETTLCRVGAKNHESNTSMIGLEEFLSIFYNGKAIQKFTLVQHSFHFTTEPNYSNGKSIPPNMLEQFFSYIMHAIATI